MLKQHPAPSLQSHVERSGAAREACPDCGAGGVLCGAGAMPHAGLTWDRVSGHLLLMQVDAA